MTTYTVEVQRHNGSWHASAWYESRQSLSEMIDQVKYCYTIAGIRIIPSMPYRIIDDDTKEVITQFTHDNLWLVERLI